MSKYEIVGLIIVDGLALLGGLAALIKPLINLNSTITKLDTSLKIFVKEKDEVKIELKEHEKKIDDHERRIYSIEHKKE